MAELLSAAQMRAVERAAIDSGAVSGLELMERAGRGVVEAIMEWRPMLATAPHRALVLCGPGNNGGDGFVAARHLRDRGWPVTLALLGSPEALKGDAARHAARWGGEVLSLSDAEPRDGDLVLDALFGAGLTRPLDGEAARVVAAANAVDCLRVAVDVPSGLDGSSGEPVGDVVLEAALTVTFFRKKPGHLLYPGRRLCGEVVLADIGIPGSVLAGIAPRCFENAPALWQADMPRRRAEAHKYSYGHLLVRAGASTGAGRLAARAGLRTGAGLVTLAGPERLLPLYALAGAAVMLAPCGGPDAWDDLLADGRRNACLIGPGNGVSDSTAAAALAALKAGKRCLLDADALTSFAPSPQRLLDAVGPDAILTPHDGEFARLFPDLADKPKLTRARTAAERCGGVVVLKGADSVIAAPDGRAAINANAPAHLSTAGTGDVLAGIAAGLLAQGMPAFEAAAAAVWIHGRAGAALGPGMIADDLVEALPGVFSALCAGSSA